MKPDNEYGLMIEPVVRYGTEYIEVRVCRRDPEYAHPIGCPSDGDSFVGYGTPRHLLGLVLDGLGMYGFITETGEPDFIAYDVEFRDVHSANLQKLGRMQKALKKVMGQIYKECASQPGDKFTAIATALKLSFAVERIVHGNRYGEDWRWMSIPEGRNRYRELIEDKVSAARERKKENA